MESIYFEHKIGLNVKIVSDNMKTYTRRITNRSKTKKEYVITIPVSFVRKLQLDEKLVEMKIKGNSIIIKNIEGTIQITPVKDESDDDFTVH